jgi:lysyl-tRNA synthetase class 1
MKYMLLKPDLQENIDIVPTGANLLRIIEDYERAVALIESNQESLLRADKKRAMAAKLSSQSSQKRGWKTAFLDLILYRSLQLGWEKIEEKTKDAESVQKLSPYIEEWERRGFIPEEYAFSYRPAKADEGSAARKFFEKLSPAMTAIEVHNLVFKVASEAGVEPKQLFEECYMLLLGKPKGPKLGKLIEAIGIEKVKADVL